MNSYADAQRVIATARSRAEGKKIGNNTRLHDYGDCLAVVLHSTRVVQYYSDGSIVLDSGGWRTKVTKNRMNEYLSLQWFVEQERGVWYLVRSERRNSTFYRQWYIFKDGIRIGPRGGCNGKRRKK